MAYHSRDGYDFIGLRRLTNGRLQVVYDSAPGKRILIDIQSTNVSFEAVDAVLQASIHMEKVLPSALSALTECNITFDINFQNS